MLALHEQLLAEFGGTAGIRDEGLLDSGLSRPENLFAYGQPKIFELGASYAFGLVKKSPLCGWKQTNWLRHRCSFSAIERMGIGGQ